MECQVFTKNDSTTRRRAASLTISDDVLANTVTFCASECTVTSRPVIIGATASEVTVSGNILMRPNGVSRTLIAVNSGGFLETSEIDRDAFFSYVPGVGCCELWTVTADNLTPIDRVDLLDWDHAYILAVSPSISAAHLAKYVQITNAGGFVDVAGTAGGADTADTGIIIWALLVSGDDITQIACIAHGFATNMTAPTYLHTNISRAVENRIAMYYGEYLHLYRPFRHGGRIAQTIKVSHGVLWRNYGEFLIGTSTEKTHIIGSITAHVFIYEIPACAVTSAFSIDGVIYVRFGQLSYLTKYSRVSGERCEDFLLGGTVLAHAAHTALPHFLTKKGDQYDLVTVHKTLGSPIP